MSTEHILFSVALFFFFLFIVSTIYAYSIYRKHLSDYEFFIKEYRQHGYYIDSMTNLSANFGFAFYYLKVMYFVRLLKNRKMYIQKGMLIDKECYDYMQSLPKEKIEWMWRWRRAFIFQAVLFIVAIAFGYTHSLIYHY